MILVSHAVIGAAVGRLFPQNPLFAFGAGFVSHFLMDAVPHWAYTLTSAVTNEKGEVTDLRLDRSFLVDLVKISIDFSLGLLFVFFLFTSHSLNIQSTLFGMAGGLFPDLLQFFSFKLKREPLTTLQKFHVGIQKYGIHNPMLGMLFQGAIVAVIYILSFRILR